MRILFLTDNFPPEVNAPASRTFEHCREWVRLGHHVTVITGAPNFPKGSLFDGYRNRLWSREEMAGIEVVRVWTYITANEGFLRRTLDYVSFMFSAIFGSLFVGKVDVVVGTSPQLFTPCAAFIVSLLRLKPYVFELRDLWPASIKAVGAMHNSLVLDWLEQLELFLYRRAAHIVSVTASFREDLVHRGIPAEKISIVMNGADLARFQPRPRDLQLANQLGLEGKVVVGYVGTHGMAHGLSTLLKAAELLHGHPQAANVQFVFLGDGAEKPALRAEAVARGLTNVLFLDSVSRDEVVRFWSLIDIALIHLKKDPLFQGVIPSKLFECMAMGIPVLHGVVGESAAIVRRDDVGHLFDPEDEDALAARVVELVGDPARRSELSRHALEAAPRYDRSNLAKTMLDTLSLVAVSRSKSPVRPAARLDIE